MRVIFRKCLILVYFPFWNFGIAKLNLMVWGKKMVIINAKQRATNRLITLSCLSKVLKDHGRYSILSFLSSLPISGLRCLDTEANKLYDSTHQLYNAALLTGCYTQDALRPYIDSEINHKRHFIKIPFINKGMEFISLPSIFKDKSVTPAVSTYLKIPKHR